MSSPTYKQISASLTSDGVWTQLGWIAVTTGKYRPYAIRGALMRDIRIMNIGTGEAAVSVCVSSAANPPGDDEIVVAAEVLSAGENLLASGIVVIPNAFAVWAKATGGYPGTLNVTVTAAVLETGD